MTMIGLIIVLVPFPELIDVCNETVMEDSLKKVVDKEFLW
jgi:hypothetical protein